MAKQRYVDTDFWNDDFILDCDTVERYFFLYLLTNGHTAICGIYKLAKKVMTRETGLDENQINTLLKRFEEANKVLYIDGWIILVNFLKHQALKGTVLMGIQKQFVLIPPEILSSAIEHGYSIDSPWILPEQSKPEFESKPESELEPKPKSESIASKAAEKPNITKDIVNYFFELKGWANKGKDFYSQNKIIYARHMRPAKELAELCEGSLEEAKECLKKLADWASSHDLDWSIETVFKKWYELDFLKAKEKKPHWDGCRIFQKNVGGKWYIIRNGEIKELGRELRKEEIIWK